MSRPESNVRAWPRKAEHDVLNIENNLAATEIPWDTVCFHAQQAAEKLLKGFLVSHGRDVTRTQHRFRRRKIITRQLDPFPRVRIHTRQYREHGLPNQ